MNKKGLGSIFLLISSILFSTAYLCTTLKATVGFMAWEIAMKESSFVIYLSIAALLIGIAFIIWGWKE